MFFVIRNVDEFYVVADHLPAAPSLADAVANGWAEASPSRDQAQARVDELNARLLNAPEQKVPGRVEYVIPANVAEKDRELSEADRALLAELRRVARAVDAAGATLADAVRALAGRLAQKPAELRYPEDVPWRGHDFEASHTGMVCGAMVELPDGTGDQCGEPIKSPMHDPVAYLTYERDLSRELGEWARREGPYA